MVQPSHMCNDATMVCAVCATLGAVRWGGQCGVGFLGEVGAVVRQRSSCGGTFLCACVMYDSTPQRHTSGTRRNDAACGRICVGPGGSGVVC